MAEVPSNPVPFSVLTEESSPFRVGLELTAYAYDDPFTPLDVIPRRADLKGMDEIGGPGGGSFRISRSDSKLTETPRLLDYRNVFKCSLDGKVVSAFFATQKKSDFVNREERAGEYWEVSGEGLRGWFHDAVVEPYGGIRQGSQDQRVFSFASEQGSWYKAADWKTPVLIQKYNLDPNLDPFNTAPAEWPDAPNAYWIWGEANSGSDPAPEGINYFRYEFDVSGLSVAEPYAFFASGKDHFEVFVDGQRVIEAKEDNAYAQTWRADFDLTNGHHIIAARVLARGSGAAAFIGALYKTGDATAGTEAELLKVTDASGWKVNAYPDPPPGWTPGEIMLTLLSEAQARGVRFPTWLTPTFTATVDSAGAVWTRELDWSFDIGTEYFDVIEKLEELVCDLWIDPQNYELSMWAERGVHRDVQSQAVEPVKFEVAKNVTRAESDGTSEIKNTLVLQTEDGWRLIADSLSTSISKYGRIEGYVSTGASDAVSGDVAQRVFDQRAEPSVSATYDIIDVEGARPWYDFFVGDWVLAPRETDETVLVPRRVMSISVQEDKKTGRPVFAVEFDTIAEDLARRFDRWLKTTSDGTLGGSLANASGSGGGGGGGTPSSQVVSKGPQGSQGPRGFPGFHYRGVWLDSEVYALSDVVSWAGSYWVAKIATNEEPGESAADWDELVVSPSTTPAIGITLYLTDAVSLPAIDTAVMWSAERYKSNITHDPFGTNVVIQDSGPYLISGKFATTTNAVRQYYLQVNGVTVATTNAASVNFSTTRAVADLDSVLLYLAAGDVVRVVSSGAATHSLQASTDTWLSIAKITGLRGDQGETGQGLTWRGEWATSTAYAVYDIVQSGGSSYICIVSHGSGSTTEPGVGANWETRWELTAQKGDQGDKGDKGDTGDQGQGLIYRGTWSSHTTYPPNSIVAYDDQLWVTAVENVGKEPGVDLEWTAFSGAGGGGGGLEPRASVTYTTASLLSGAGETGSVVLGETYQLLRVDVSRECRVRLYATASGRSADSSRPLGVYPSRGSDHGVTFEAIFLGELLSLMVSPVVVGANMEATPSPSISLRIDNLSDEAGTVSVTFTYVRQQ